MKERPLYSVVPHEHVEAFVHEDVQGERVPTDETPFGRDAAQFFAVVGNEKKRIRKAVDEDALHLRRISGLHGRSYEFPWGVYWRDKYGNLFSRLNGKGNNCTDVEAFTSNVAPSGFGIRGLQDSDSLVRVLRASDYLRSKNVSTEMLVHVLEPATLPVDGTMLPLAQVKTRIIEKVFLQNGKKTPDEDDDKPTPDDIPRLTQALRDMTFFITIRGMQVNERVRDLEYAATPEAVQNLLRPALHFVNTEEHMRTARDGGDPKYFSPDNPEDIRRYLEEELPLRCAQNFASMHTAGVTLGFAHAGNVSLTGGICDLDSAKGTPLNLGDEEQDRRGYMNDVREFLQGIVTITSPKDEGGYSCMHGGKFIQRFAGRYIHMMGTDTDGRIAKAATRTQAMYSSAYPPDDDEARQEQMLLALMSLDTIVNQSMVDMQVFTFMEGARLESDEILSPETKYYLRRLAHERMFSMLRMTLMNEIPDTMITPLIRTFSHALAVEATGWDPYDAKYTGHAQAIPSSSMQDVACSLGLEENIAKNANAIDVLFNSFSYNQHRSILEYYCQKLGEQLDVDFRCPMSPEECVAEFHKHDQRKARRLIAKTIQTTYGPGNMQRSIVDALKEHKYCHDPRDRYVGFVCKQVDRAWKNSPDIQKAMKTIGKQHWSVSADIIRGWVTQVWSSELASDLPLDLDIQMVEDAIERIDALRRKIGISNKIWRPATKVLDEVLEGSSVVVLPS